MYGIELIDVDWADEVVILYVTRRMQVCGDVYRVVFNDIAREYIGRPCTPHDEQDKEAIEVFTDLLNDEQRAREVFYVE